MSGKKRIAVLGAGPMGLSAAYHLARQGVEVVLFEADDRLGGMSASFDFGGIALERYYHFHCISDAAYLTLLDDLGLSHKMHWKATRMSYWFQGKLQPWGNPLALLRFSGLGLVAKIRYGLHAFCCTRRNSWNDLDALEASAWIRRWVGPEAWDILWKRLFTYKFYEYADQLSAAWIWSRIRRIGRSRYNLMQEKLGYLEGGTDTFLNAMRARLEAQGVQVRLSAPVTRLVSESGQVTGLRYRDGDQEVFEAFDRVVSTIPLPFVARIAPDLPEAEKHLLEAVRNIPVVCVIVKLRRSVTDSFWVNTHDPEMDIPGFVEYSNLRPLPEAVVYTPFYMPETHPHYQDGDQVFIDKVSRYLKKINPELIDSDFIDWRVSRYRYAQPVCFPRHLETLPPVTSKLKGFFLADTSYYYPEDRGISESIAFGRHLAGWVMEDLV